MNVFPLNEVDKQGNKEEFSVSVVIHDTNGGWHIGWYNYDLKSWMHFGPEKIIDADCWMYLPKSDNNNLIELDKRIIVKCESHD